MAKNRSLSGDNANYDYKSQKQPMKRMGQGAFANMPEQPMLMGFGEGATYRDGLINSFSCNVSEVSKIDENEK